MGLITTIGGYYISVKQIGNEAVTYFNLTLEDNVTRDFFQ